MADLALNILTTFETMSCGTCGIVYAVPDWFNKERHLDHSKDWYCPNGHNWHYSGETEAQTFERERDAAKRDAEWQRQLREKADKQLRKLERRIKNGVCPCCQRHFENLERHIKDKHPQFSKSEVGERTRQSDKTVTSRSSR